MINKYFKLLIRNKILITFIIMTYFFVPHKTNAATLSISPSASTVSVGNIVTVKIVVNTLNKSINNAEGEIQFPVDMLEVLSVTKSSSVFSLWVEEPSFSNYTGKIVFNGGVPTPGFIGQNGYIISITFKAEKIGTASVVFSDGAIRENDGLGTDITSNLLGATFSIKEAVPKVETPKPKPVPTPIPEPLVPTIEVVDLLNAYNNYIVQPLPIPKVPKSPEIMIGMKDGAQSIVGSSGYPKAQALISFVAQDGVKIFILGDADVNGNFNILVPSPLKHGLYAVTATMVKKDKTNSEVSNAIIVKIGNIIFDITWELWLFILILIVVILDLILHIYFHFRKNGNVDKHIQ